MQRYARFLQWSVVFWSAACCVTSCLADGAPMPFYQEAAGRDPLDPGFLSILLVGLVSTVLVEYLVVYLLLGRPTKSRTRLFVWVLLINVITNPAAQLTILYVADPVLLGSANLANLVFGITELLVVIVEFWLLKWAFGRMYRRGVLTQPVAATRTFVISLAANTASFVATFGAMILLAGIIRYLSRLHL